MHRHYLTFSRQAVVLDSALRDWVLAECWSQEKNVLLLHFIRGKESRFVEIALDAQLGYALITDHAVRARKNTIDFFGSYIGVALTEVWVHHSERAIFFRFADRNELAAFFFGRGSGNVLALQNGSIVSSFQSHASEYERVLTDQDVPAMPNRTELIAGLHSSPLPPLKALTALLPVLGKRLATECLFRAGLADAESLNDAENGTLALLLNAVDEVYAEAEESTTCYLYHLPHELVFSLLPLRSCESQTSHIQQFTDIAEGIRSYRSAMYRTKRFGDLRGQVLKKLKTDLAKCDYALANKRTEKDLIHAAAEYEQYAELLLGQQRDVPEGISSVTLKDWDGYEHTIKLDSKLNAIGNAEAYYKRARNAREAMKTVNTERQELEARRQRTVSLLEQAEQTEEIALLERIMSGNKELFAPKGEKKPEGTAERFRRFVVEGGYEVFAGKNSANNDELTVRFARPNDYWFHARGSSGSHVVLRWNDSKSKPPKETIRQAASIAAYYSGAKNAKMVPVAYTLKKHVRKPRGAAPGAVIMEREDVIMVEPKLP